MKALLLLLLLPSLAEAQVCAEVSPAVVVAPTQIAAELPDRLTTAAYEVAVFADGTPVTGTPFRRATISAWTSVGQDCYTAVLPVGLASAMQGQYRGAIRPVVTGPPDWSPLSNLFAYVAAPLPPPPPSGCPECVSMVIVNGEMWTLGPVAPGDRGGNFPVLRNKVHDGGSFAAGFYVKDGQLYVFNSFLKGWYLWTPLIARFVMVADPRVVVPPIAPAVVKHLRITIDGVTYEGDLPTVP